MMRMPVAAVSNAIAVSVAADCRPSTNTNTNTNANTNADADAAATSTTTKNGTFAAASAAAATFFHEATSNSSEPYSAYSSSSLSSSSSSSSSLSASSTPATAAAGAAAPPPPSFSALQSRHHLHRPHRRLAAAPPPPTPPPLQPTHFINTNIRHPAHRDALAFPPSPSPTQSHATTSSNYSNYSNYHDYTSHCSNSVQNHHVSGSRPSTKPGQCPVMALQNVLCDDADAGPARRNTSRPSQPPTPPLMHDASHAASVSMLPASVRPSLPPPPPPPGLTMNPISPAALDGSEPLLVTRPNPSHVVMTTRPQLQPPRVQQSDPGCKTCQIRKLPCDERRPTCQNCARMGIHCLGYFNPPSHAQVQQHQTQTSGRSVLGISANSAEPSGTTVNANASRQEQEEYLYFLLDHYRNTKRHCMWDLITLDFNEHFSCKMRKEALQMIKRRRFKDREAREPSPADSPPAPPRPKAKRGRRPKLNAPAVAGNAPQPGTEPTIV